MTYREYIEKLLEIIKGEDILSCDPRTVLPRPEENDNGMLAAFMAASDPHFIAARKQNPFWYIRAQQELEKFAKQVGSMLNPDSESITEEVMKFLEDFLARNVEMKALDKEREQEKDEEEEVEEFEGEEGDDEEENGDDGETDDEPQKVQDDGASGLGFGIGSNEGEGEQPGESSIDDLLDGLFPQPESSNMKEDDSKQDKDKTNSKKGDDNPENNEEVDDEEQSNTGFSLEDSHSDDEIEDGLKGDGIGSGNSKNENRRRENIFLRSIPKGLFELAKLIGRSGSVGFKPSGSFPSASKSDITGITIGDNLSSILPSETAMLSCPATQTVFFRNFVEKRLQIFASASSGQEPIEHQDGPVIICLDTSGSMIGEKIDTACKLTLAITIIAQRRHRNVLVVKYSDWHYLYKVTNMARDKDGLLQFLNHYAGMGNSENELFRWLFEDVLPKEPDFDSADILCVTDFGWERLYGGTLERIERAKREGVKFYGLNVFDGEDPDGFIDYCDETMSIVCDSLWTYQRGKCWEEPIPKAGKKKTANNKKAVDETEKRHRSKASKRKKIGFL